jgi:mRNA interferase HigB
MRKARFTNSAELKATFGSADPLGQGLVVFNIGGNKYRLIAYVHYATPTNIGRVFVQHVFTHAEYDEWSDERR